MHPLQEPADPVEALALVRRYLKATYRIAKAALGATDLQELYGQTHAIVRDLMPAENCYIALWDQASGTVSFPYFVDAFDSAPEPRALRRGLTEYVLRTRQPLLADGAILARLEAEGEVEPIGAESLAWLGAPLIGDGGVFGALVIQIYDGDRRYTSEERDLLVFVSGQVAMAIERQRAEASHRMMAAAVDRTRDSVFGVDGAGRIAFVNEAACLELGYSREELLQLSLADVDCQFPADQWPAFMATLRERGTLFVETEHRRKDGSTLPVEISACRLVHEGRDLAFGYARDISERKASDLALRASEEKFSKAFHASPDAINLTRIEDGTYLDVSDGFVRLTGWLPSEAIGRSALDLGIWVHPRDRIRAIQLLEDKGEFTGLEAPFRCKDGTILTGLMSGKVVEVDGARCLLSITRDITERKASERRLRTVLSNSQAITYQLDAEGRFTLSEGLGLANIGLAPGEVVGHSAFEIYAGDPVVLGQIRRAMKGQASREITRYRDRLFDNFLTPVLNERGEVESIIGIAADTTERRKAEEALLAERGLFVGGPVMVFKWRAAPGWPVEYVSPNVEDILGYPVDDLLRGTLSFEGLMHPDDLPRILQEIHSHETQGHFQFEQQYRLRTARGEYRWFYDFSAAAGPGPVPSHFLGYLLDITDRKEAEDTMRQAQKLESLGVLAGGIAHDFNNLLTVVMGNLNLAQMNLPEASPALPYLSNMEATVLRATELTKQMLAYSGRGHFMVKPQDLNALVGDLTNLLEVSISKKVRLRCDLEPGLPAIQADLAQIQQVVMNLVINASDAIGDQEGAIHLTTSVQDLDGQTLMNHYRVKSPMPGRHVMLEVDDTGCGMAPEVMHRIFDPFFTTKANGRGLGLSAILGILRGHGAGLSLASQVGRGSRFTLCFPAMAGEASPGPSGNPPPPADRPFHGLMLLVDDEDHILETTGRMLAALGLQVVVARDGLEALERFREHQQDLRLVLMDLTMPRMDGREAFRAMRELDPRIPVVLSSGFMEQDSLQSFPHGGPAAFLQKPYQLKDLRATLRGALEG